MVGNSIGMGAYSPTATDGPWVDVVCTPVEVTPTTGAATGTVTSATAGTTVTMFAISGSGAAVNATVTVTGAGWTANNFVGDLLVLTGGTGAGQTAMILSNTSTVITIEGTWPVTTPTSSTTFEIETPINGSTFSSTEAQPPGATQYAYDAGTSVFYIAFNDDPFSGVGLSALALAQNTTGDPTFSVDGCSFAPNIHNFPTSGVTVSGSSAAMRYNATSNLTGSALFVANGNGLFLSNNVTLPAGAAAEVATAVRVLGGVTGFSLGGSVFATGNYVTAATATDNAFIQVDGAGVAALTANYVSGSNYGVRAGPGSSVYSGGNTWASQANYGITFSIGYPAGFYPNGVLIEDGDVCNSTGSGCFNIPGGKAALQQDAVTGSGNAAVITATAGGTVDIQVLPTATASTATNEILVDGTGYSWATYATAGESIASNVGTTVFGPTVTQQVFQSGITVPANEDVFFDVAQNDYCVEISGNLICNVATSHAFNWDINGSSVMTLTSANGLNVGLNQIWTNGLTTEAEMTNTTGQLNVGGGINIGAATPGAGTTTPILQVHAAEILWTIGNPSNGAAEYTFIADGGPMQCSDPAPVTPCICGPQAYGVGQFCPDAGVLGNIYGVQPNDSCTCSLVNIGTDAGLLYNPALVPIATTTGRASGTYTAANTISIFVENYTGSTLGATTIATTSCICHNFGF